MRTFWKFDLLSVWLCSIWFRSIFRIFFSNLDPFFVLFKSLDDCIGISAGWNHTTGVFFFIFGLLGNSSILRQCQFAKSICCLIPRLFRTIIFFGSYIWSRCVWNLFACTKFGIHGGGWQRCHSGVLSMLMSIFHLRSSVGERIRWVSFYHFVGILGLLSEQMCLLWKFYILFWYNQFNFGLIK